MSATLVTGNLQGFTLQQLGTTKAASAAAHHQAEESFVSPWVMISTILSCLAVMMAVVIATATSLS